ncbi:MAG: hypothetical protein HYV61_13095 [Candidatus Rokubacteria bacterium]|nr:hypothetical protein [Candidatus Rokubacteria bacterium]MBI2879056.1 hypothetical protein [Candidatus Rokubacteria bacterium]
MTGRSLHDALLRVLTDAGLRRRLRDGDPAVAEALGGEEAGSLRRADPERLRRLARFFARHFYRERIVRLFRYGRALALAAGRDPLGVLDSVELRALLDEAVLGSPATAEAVARLVEAELLGALADRPFGSALVAYEGAMFRVEAGPRGWRAPATPRDGLPVRSPHARLLDLEWNLIPLIAALRAGAGEPPEPPREPTRYLLALSPYGRVTSLRCSAPVARLIEALDGQRSVVEAAATAGLGEAQARELVARLTELGAVEWRAGSG